MAAASAELAVTPVQSGNWPDAPVATAGEGFAPSALRPWFVRWPRSAPPASRPCRTSPLRPTNPVAARQLAGSMSGRRPTTAQFFRPRRRAIELFPRATVSGSRLFLRHSRPMKTLEYFCRFSPFPQRVWLRMPCLLRKSSHRPVVARRQIRHRARSHWRGGCLAPGSLELRCGSRRRRQRGKPEKSLDPHRQPVQSDSPSRLQKTVQQLHPSPSADLRNCCSPWNWLLVLVAQEGQALFLPRNAPSEPRRPFPAPSWIPVLTFGPNLAHPFPAATRSSAPEQREFRKALARLSARAHARRTIRQARRRRPAPEPASERASRIDLT